MKNSGQNISLFAKAFFSIYIFIYVFPFPISYIPYGYLFITRHLDWVKGQLNLLFAKKVFGINDIIFNPMNGSGDTTLDYVALTSYSIIALATAVLLVLLVKGKIDKLYSFMLTYARYFVGLTLISYGVVKFLVGQFPGPSYFSLESTFGDFSPMGLAWRFFGYSDLYKGFMGVAEILAGFLLLIRRTKVLGALITISVTINIFLVNLSFDVPVKLFSGHLLFFSILIVFPYISKLASFFLLHQPAQISDDRYTFDKKWKRLTYISIKVILIIILPITMVTGHVASQKIRVYLNEWEGIYDVQSTSSLTEHSMDSLLSIQKIIVQGKSIMTVDSHKAKQYYTIDNIWNEGEINFIKDGDQEDPFTLFISEKENLDFLISWKMDGANIEYITKRKLKHDYLLVNRGFHWINEIPFNR